MSAAEKRKTAFFATGIAFCILVAFVIVGEFVLSGMGIPLTAFQIAGGIVLFIFALTMIFGESKPEEEIKLSKNVQDTAMNTSLASPGAMMAAVLLTENNSVAITEQVGVITIISIIMIAALLCMLTASKIGNLIGSGGASIISRIMVMNLWPQLTHSRNKEYFS